MMQGMAMEEIRDAIVDAYEPTDLEQTVRFSMNVKLHSVAPLNSDYEYLVFKLINWADQRGREVELIQAVTKRRPAKTKMRELSKKYELAVPVHVQEAGAAVAGAPTDASGKLEEIVSDHLKFIDFKRWMEQMSRIENLVCRIKIGDDAKGTGFLVGPDAVLTNYHVMRSVIESPARASTVTCEFDYKTPAKTATGGVTGTPAKLHADWNIDSSPYTQAEHNGSPDQGLPNPDELDYALIRLAEKIGNKPWGSNPGEDAPKRGWMWVRDTFKPEDPLIKSPMGVLIAQHPVGLPLRLAIDTRAIDNGGVFGLNANKTRVRYATNTLGGSSGSPLLDMDCRLIALHHYGDKTYQHPAYNQGIPIEAIRKLLESRGKAGNLGGKLPDDVN